MFHRLQPGMLMLSFLAMAVPAHSLDIVVDSTLDFAEQDAEAGREDRYTCGFTSDAIFQPAPNGVCTLRRAVLEAGVRPDDDRPIRILFDLPTSDPNYDPTLQHWEVQIDSSFVWEIDRRFVTDDGGQITIDGSSQPIGRSDGPRILINTNADNNPLGGRSLEVRTAKNVIQNLGLLGGGEIILYDKDNIVQNVSFGDAQ